MYKLEIVFIKHCALPSPNHKRVDKDDPTIFSPGNLLTILYQLY